MSQLAVQSLLNIDSLAGRLLTVLTCDLRPRVHRACLMNLLLLARKGPHLLHAFRVEVCGISSTLIQSLLHFIFQYFDFDKYSKKKHFNI